MIRRLLKLGALLVGLVVAYLVVTTVQVVAAAGRDDRAPTGAIVVMGAAQYDGRPSPDLEARLGKALALYRAGVAPAVVVTGGRRPGDAHTEAGSGADWLAARGVPQSAILREVNGRDTYQSLDATAGFLHGRGITSVVLVSDPFHDERISLMAGSLGLRAGVSPSAASPINGAAALPYYGKEVAEVAVGRVIGWRRLNGVIERLGIAGA